MGWCDLCATCKKLANAKLTPIHPVLGKSEIDELFLFDPSPKSSKKRQRISVLDPERHVTPHLHYWRNIFVVDSDSPSIAYKGTEIVEAAKAGCNLCTLYLGQPYRERPMGPVPGSQMQESVGLDDGSSWIPVLEESRDQGSRKSYSQLYLLPLCHSGSRHKICYNKSRHESSIWPTALTVDYIPPGEWKQPSPYRGLDEVDPATIIEIRAWINDCCVLGVHEKCSQLSARLGFDKEDLPQRLIEVKQVGSELQLRLVDTAPLKEERNVVRHDYLTLSYCWGRDEMACKLRRTNLADYRKRIPADCLPKAFTDAALFATWISVPYLWIDALCIMQDDKDEWNQEAPRMALIYGNATVCLGAVAAKDPQQGLFTQNHCQLPCFFEAPYFSAASTYVRVEDTHTNANIKGPLDERAWAFQEKYLSPRMIYCMYDQLRWSCATECSWEVKQHDSKGQRAWEIYTGTLRPNASSHLEKIRIWKNLVEQFTAREITRTTDRLVAMSGVAQAFARTESLSEGGETQPWLAGLWRSLPLLSQLAWSVHLLSDSRDPKRQKRKARLDIAPSWSWGSVQQPVSWDSFSSDDTDPRCIVSAASIQPDTINLYSPAATGRLRMRAALCQLGSNDGQRITTIYQTFDVLPQESTYCCEGAEQDKDHCIMYFNADSRECIRNKRELFFMPMLRAVRGVSGPTLQPVYPDRGVYQRVGYFSVTRHYFDQKEVAQRRPYCHTSVLDAGTRDLPDQYFMESHGDGIYTFEIV